MASIPAPPDRPHDSPLGHIVVRTVFVMLTLAVLKIVLTLPGDIGPEDFLALGLHGGRLMDDVREAWWHLVLVGSAPHAGLSLAFAAIAYFVIDTAMLVPLYTMLLLTATHRIAVRTQETMPRWRRAFPQVVACATAILTASDLIENSSALGTLGEGSDRYLILAFATVALLVAAMYWRGLKGPQLLQHLSSLNSSWAWTVRFVSRILPVGIVLAAVALLVATFARIEPTNADPTMIPSFVAAIVGGSHTLKVGLLIVLALLFVVRGIHWIFHDGEHLKRRVALRRLTMNLLGRSRYVILALVLLIALTVIMDQCRDVAVGMADAMFSRGHLPAAWGAFALSILAIWAMAFSCWFWTRVICRMRSPRGPDPDAAEMNATMQIVAKQLARAFGLVPLIAAALLSGLAARDALWAANARDAAITSPFVLLMFGLLAVAGGHGFLWDRERSNRRAAGHATYWDDLDPHGQWLESLAKEKYRLGGSWGPGALGLPILALFISVGVRAIVSVIQPHVSFAFVVIVFSLVTWLGLFGWLSIKERREGRPWVLALIAIVGVLGLAGFTDNHEVRVIRTHLSGALPATGIQVLGSLLIMGYVAGVALLVLRSAGRSNQQGPQLKLGRGLALVAGASFITLIAIDQLTRNTPNSHSGPVSRVPLTVAFDNWTTNLRKSHPEPGVRVFFVTSEGGGIRAAYWTARTLEALEMRMDDFNARTFMLSGVSGGALGEAVYIGCSREPRVRSTADCIQNFGEIDLLTPMVGAWLFEDAVGRVLPTAQCTQPGCGFLSRGLWFEQGLERAVPGLDRGIARIDRETSGYLPHLFLNSTWVESGDRAIASGVYANWHEEFLSARDQIAWSGQGGADQTDLPLSAAAHNAARFPYFNAIGILRNARGKAAHMADGGYFDNSGGHTTEDVLASFRNWIGRQRCAADAALECTSRLNWLRSLRLTVITIQNGVNFGCDQSGRLEDRVECIEGFWHPGRPQTAVAAYEPDAPRNTNSFQLFTDVLGPIITALNVSGVGANGRRAEALLGRACGRDGGLEPCVVQLAQRNDGSLYPLGWYLSASARAALDWKALAEVERSLPTLVDEPRDTGSFHRSLSGISSRMRTSRRYRPAQSITPR
jgi:hypothetical protein